MKKISVLLACALVLLALGQAAGQGMYPTFVTGFRSLEGTITGGLSVNEIDRSLSFDKGHGTVGSPFLLLGVVGNPALVGNGNGYTGSFQAGYYQPGSLPFSAFGYLGITDRTNALPANLTALGSNDMTNTVTSGTTTTDYIWSSTLTDATYSLPSQVNALSGEAFGLVTFSGVTTGLFAYANGNWTATDAAAAAARYSDQTVTTQYDTSGAATAVPAPATDYTVQTVTKNINPLALPAAGQTGSYTTTSNLIFAIPAAIKVGSLENAAEVVFSLTGSDNSGSYSIVNSKAASTALGAAVNDRTIDIVSNTSQMLFGLQYQATLPGLFGPGGKLYAGVSFRDAVTSGNYSYDSVTKPNDLSTLNAKTAVAGGTHASQVDTYAAANYFGFSAMAGHSIELSPLQDTLIVLKPALTFGFSTDQNDAFNGSGGAILTGSVDYSQTLDATYVNDIAVAYNKNTTVVTGDAAKTDTVDVTLSLPTAFKVKPAGWPLGFTAGATGTLDFAWATSTTSGETTTVTTENITDTTVNTTTVTKTVNAATSSTTLNSTLGETHSFGLFLPFQGGMRLDVDLNGSNLLALESLTFQLYVPLK